jgi:transposase
VAQLVAIHATTHHPFYYKTSQLAPDQAPPFAAEWVRKVEAYRETLCRARPDVLVMVGSDHFHQLWLDNMPQFLIGKAPFYDANWENEQREFGMPKLLLKGDEELSAYMLREGIDRGFDLAFSNELRIDHSITLCKVAERQMLRASFVPPRPIRQLRDLTRYRIDLVGARTTEKNRVEKLLEDACIKLSVVASDIFGVSGRQMMAALIAGERDPKVLAEMARTRMRAKIPQLVEAFTAQFDDHHRFLLAQMLARIDGIEADIAVLDAQIEAHLTPFDLAIERLDEIPGIGPVAAAVIIAEIGVDMTRFPTAGHLCSWAKFSPGIKSSAGKNKSNGSTGHGDRYLARVLGEAAPIAGRTDTFLGERYRRIARRRGKKKAIVAVGRPMLVIIWHLLSDPETRFIDLGADHFMRHVNTQAKKRNHVRQLEALGYRVTLETAA